MFALAAISSIIQLITTLKDINKYRKISYFFDRGGLIFMNKMLDRIVCQKFNLFFQSLSYLS